MSRNATRVPAMYRKELHEYRRSRFIVATMAASPLALVIFTPLLATWSIWVGIAISTRISDVRVAQQLGTFAGLPVILVVYLLVFNVIHATLSLTLGVGAALLILDGMGWWLVSAAFDRERLITGTRG